jgi:spermidine/putrescine transport system permease protein
MSDFNRNPLIDWALKFYVIFWPLPSSLPRSPPASSSRFNVDRFPSLPLGGFSTTGTRRLC